MVLVALADREQTEQALKAVTAKVGEALRVLLAEDVSAERAAALLEVDVAEIRRLAKVTAPAGATAAMAKPADRPAANAPTVTALPGAVGGEGATRRAG